MNNSVEILVKSFEEIEKERSIDTKSRYLMRTNPYKDGHSVNGAIEGRVDDALGGCVYVFPTQLNYDGKIYPIMSGTDFWVSQAFRKFQLGLMIPEKMLDISPNYLFAGVSKNAQPVYQYFGFELFDLQRFVYIVNSHFLVSLKLKGILAKIATLFANASLYLFYDSLRLFFKIKYWKFKVVEKSVDDIDYDGVSNIINADMHRYKEYHGKEWIKWVMNYSDKHPESQQHFYEIYRKGELVGFFLNKNKFRELLNGKYQNVIYGSIIEWGSINQDILKDSDICAIAFSKFGKRTDAIAMCSHEEDFFNEIPRKVRKRMGNLNYAVILDEKKFPDYQNENNWRIRPAGGDASF